MCTRSSAHHCHMQSREYHKKTMSCGNEHGRPTNITLAQLKKTRVAATSRYMNCSRTGQLNADSDTKEKTTSGLNTPLENSSSLEDLVFLSKTPHGQRFCQICLIDVNLFALHFLATLLELTLNFPLVVRRRCWAFLLGALAV